MRRDGEESREVIEERLINEEYKIWKKNTPFLYDLIITHALEWPSLTVEWLPGREEPSEKDYALQKMILGTHTNEDELNYLMLAQVQLPREDSENDARHYEDFQSNVGGFGCATGKVEVIQRIIHDGEVNRARYMPQNDSIIATKTVNAEVYIFDYSKHPTVPPSNGVCNPELRLMGHNLEGYGLSWSKLKPGHLLSGSDDSQICMWDINATPTNKTLDAMNIYKAHDGVVEDVAWHSRHEYLFGSVGDDRYMHLWDLRSPSANKPVKSTAAHNAEVNCLAFNPLNEWVVATGSADTTVKLFDLRKFNSALYTFDCHNSGIRSSFVWRDETEQVFSTSRRDEDDEEEALKWAALEKLPTFNRLRKGLLATLDEPLREIDVKELGFQQKQQLLERLVKVGAQDNEQFLIRLRERIDRVGIEVPSIEVRFENLTVQVDAYTGTRALPSVFNSSRNMLEGFLSYLHILPKSKRSLSILHEISGIIKPGRMTLLLGPPSSGKTTLLLALAGRLKKDMEVSGEVTYNGQRTDKFVPQRSSAYVSQNDLHIGELTVKETLAFSARCQGVGANYGFYTPLFHNNILGLEGCANTMVGNQMIKGISGGEKKRLTTGEMLVGPAKVFFMDEISTGLDTSTTFQIINSITQTTKILNGTTIISLLQPSPEVYQLFDDIILLSEGHIVYQGPHQNVQEFFEQMGFKCPKRKAVADYLQEVTSRKEQEQYWMHKDKPYNFVSVKKFAEAIQSFHVGMKLKSELSIPFDKTKIRPATLQTKRYGINKKQLLKACISRELLLMKRSAFIYIFKMVDLTVMATLTTSLFLRTNMPKRTMADGTIFMGAMFFTTLKLMFNGLAELSMTVQQLPIFYKQRDLLFYPSWAYSIPKWILKLPISVIEVAIWVSISYYGMGFDPNIGRFFKQFLVLLCLHQTGYGLFRFVAGLGRTPIIANTLGFSIFTIYLIFGGFTLSREDVKKWWIWGYWSSPLMYCQNSITVNEFLGKSWSHVPKNSTESLGLQVLKSRGIFQEAYWYWIGVGALLGFCFLFNSLYTLCLAYLNPIQNPQAILSDDVPVKGKSNRKKPRGIRRNESGEDKRSIVLPFEPHSITFDEIKYEVDMPQEMKRYGFNQDRVELLKGVSGSFRAGVLTALMGVSGAGKTTLMDVLAGRKTGGYIHGAIKISGYPKKQQTFARVSAYVEQNDIHSPHVTVYESLLFSAWLRLSPKVDSKTRKLFIWEVMELVELSSLRECLVGLAGVNGLSSEQRKRLTIAVELVANPSIIFMDEPTSGLDARAAAIVMRTVKNTVNTGRTVVCTIHQPSIHIFDAFDELLLLKRGGEEIYFGPLGHHACHLINYFEGINGIQKIKDGYNPATWMMEISSPYEEAKLNVDFASIYKDSEIYRRNKAMIKELSEAAPDTKDIHFPQQYAQSFFSQCRACLWKQCRSYWRNTGYNTTRVVFILISGILFGTAFWGLGLKRQRQQDLFNAMGSMYTAILLIGVNNALAVQPVVAIERAVFYRERAAGMYSAIPYAIGQVMIEIPYCLCQTVIYGILVYSMVGFEWSAAKFFWYIFFMYFTLLYFTYFGMMSIAISPSQSVAAIISSAFYPLWNVFSGFVIPRTRIPSRWQWYCWANPFGWSLYGLLVSQYGDVKEKLDTGETVEEFLRSYFGYRYDFLEIVAPMVVAFAVFFAFIFAYSVKVLNFQRR